MKIYFNPLSPSSVAAAMKDLEAYKRKLMRLETELPKALAEYGVIQAQAKFDTAAYDVMVSGGGGHPSISVSPVQIDEKTWAIVANGHEVCFVEFGAGVWFNGDGGNYKGERPPGVVGIGEYGLGNGNKPFWARPKNAGGGLTRGTPASNAMYFTTQDIRERIAEEAKRILSDD